MKALVCGAGGFIGSHMVKRLISEGYWVRGVDLKYPEFGPSAASDFIQGDLRSQKVCDNLFHFDGKPIRYDEVYQFAADMGGAGYIFTGENDANVMHNSALININMVERCAKHKVGKVFYSSSACIYPTRNQLDPDSPLCAEDSAYPADPDSEYGWEKLFSERIYAAFGRNYGLNVRTARFHNIFGPEGTWDGGKEKAPAALSRKVIQAEEGGVIEVWGSGAQTRSFLYIDECIEGVRRLMDSDVTEVVNIGSEEMISINGLARLISEISSKGIGIRNIAGPEGVKGRNSDNRLIQELLGWRPTEPLRLGLERTYAWIEGQVAAASLAEPSLAEPSPAA